MIEDALNDFNSRQSYLHRHELTPTEKKGLSSFLIAAVQNHIRMVLDSELDYVYDTEEELEQLEQYVNVIKMLVDLMSTDREVTFRADTLARYNEQFLTIDFDEVDKQYKVAVHIEDPTETSAR